MCAFKKSSPPSNTHFAGIHLAGANSHKTSIAILGSTTNFSSFRLIKLYEKIGSLGSLFSDDRVVEILAQTPNLAEVFIDCPLTLPPCARCMLAACPGALACSDPSVGMMLKSQSQSRHRGAKKARAFNPQSHRLWDVWQSSAGPRSEPSYSANLAPLVTRAMVLTKRLHGELPHVTVRETQVSSALSGFLGHLGFDQISLMLFKNFEKGLAMRREILEALVKSDTVVLTSDDVGRIGQTVEGFSGFITALVGAYHYHGLTTTKPIGFTCDEGWVYLPHVGDENGV